MCDLRVFIFSWMVNILCGGLQPRFRAHSAPHKILTIDIEEKIYINLVMKSQ